MEEIGGRRHKGCLLWQGEPQKGFLLKPSGAYLIPFSLVRGGFAVLGSERPRMVHDLIRTAPCQPAQSTAPYRLAQTACRRLPASCLVSPDGALPAGSLTRCSFSGSVARRHK